jgi:uncharacterized membrane protein YfcA
VPILEALASVTVVAFGLAVLAVVLRYRRAGAVERQQLKWLFAVVVVAAVAFPIALLLPESLLAQAALIVGLLSLLALPLAIGVAVMRYRLYEIDRLISRTIAWGVVSALLLAAFLVPMIALPALLDDVTQGDTLAVAASTLLAAALFQPVRHRVQRTVDRRFDRARYDAQRTADAFAERLRHEVDLDAIGQELEGVVAEAMRPSRATLWLPGRDTSAWR